MTAQTSSANDRITLAELERIVIDKLVESRTEATQAAIKKAGNGYVADGKLRGYTAARYGRGEWVSPGVIRRVQKALAERQAP